MLKVCDINKDIFEKSFLNMLPKTCSYCGSDMLILESLNHLYCENPKCPGRIGSRLYNLFCSIGILDFSFDDCIEIVKLLNLKSPYEIFISKLDKIGSFFEIDSDEILFLESEIQKFSILNLGTYVYLGFFKNLGVSVYRVLSNYSEISKFYSDLLKGGIPFLQKLLLKDSSIDSNGAICIEAVLMYRSFIENRSEILENIKNIKIVQPEIEYPVYFASDSLDYNSNLLFLQEVNKKLNYKLYLYPIDVYTDDIVFVYWEEMRLKKKNSFITDILSRNPMQKLLNSDNFYEVLLEELQ